MNNDTPADAIELKPCPFCQMPVQHRFALHVSDGNTDDIIHAAPTECGLQYFSVGSADQGVTVAKAWNARAALAAQDNYVDATYLRECWNNCLGMDVSDWAHENVHDMLDTIERQGKEIASLRDYITTARHRTTSLAAQDGLVEALNEFAPLTNSALRAEIASLRKQLEDAREALVKTQWELETIDRTQSTNFRRVQELILANREALKGKS